MWPRVLFRTLARGRYSAARERAERAVAAAQDPTLLDLEAWAAPLVTSNTLTVVAQAPMRGESHI